MIRVSFERLSRAGGGQRGIDVKVDTDRRWARAAVIVGPCPFLRRGFGRPTVYGLSGWSLRLGPASTPEHGPQGPTTVDLLLHWQSRATATP